MTKSVRDFFLTFCTAVSEFRCLLLTGSAPSLSKNTLDTFTLPKVAAGPIVSLTYRYSLAMLAARARRYDNC